MAVSYNKLWKLLVDRKMSKADLRKQAAIAPNTMTKLRRDKEVTLEVLGKICKTPVIHNITMEQLRDKYPSVAEIQAINSQDYTCDQIAILFAAQLIKRLKL